MKIFFRNLGQLFKQDQLQLQQTHDTQFDQSGERLDRVEGRLDVAEPRLGASEQRQDTSEQRLDAIAQQAGKAAEEQSLFQQAIEARLESLEALFQQRLEEQQAALNKQIEERFTSFEQLNEARLNGLEARLEFVEPKIEEKVNELAAQVERRAHDFEASLQEQFHQLDAALDERLSNYERAVDDRIQAYTDAIDARIEERLQNIEVRSDERTVQLTEAVNQMFDQRARALDLRMDDRLGHLERNLDQRMTSYEKGIDQRLYTREKYADERMVKYNQDVIARTDVLLQQFDQRLDKMRRALRLVLTAEKSESSPAANLAAFDQLTVQRGTGSDSTDPLSQSPQAAKALYHEIVDWKKIASDALHQFTADEQEIVDYILSFVPQDKPDDVRYARQHLRRFVTTLQRIPPPRSTAARALELGSEIHFTPALKKFGGYSKILCANWSELDSGLTEQLTRRQHNGTDSLTFEVAHFNAERDRFPYPDGHFSLVLCCEMLEHLIHDPMHMLWECNRVLEKDGFLLLTTPNLSSARSLEGVLLSCQPYLFSQFNVRDVGGQHHREYTPNEVRDSLIAAGFTVVALETEDVWAKSNPAVLNLLKQLQFSTDMRGDNIFALARKTNVPVERYPEWLYIDGTLTPTVAKEAIVKQKNGGKKK